MSKKQTAFNARTTFIEPKCRADHITMFLLLLNRRKSHNSRCNVSRQFLTIYLVWFLCPSVDWRSERAHHAESRHFRSPEPRQRVVCMCIAWSCPENLASFDYRKLFECTFVFSSKFSPKNRRFHSRKENKNRTNLNNI